MSKQEILETLREAIRRARIERDNGNDAAHDTVVQLTGYLNQVRMMNAANAKAWAAQRGLED